MAACSRGFVLDSASRSLESGRLGFYLFRCQVPDLPPPRGVGTTQGMATRKKSADLTVRLTEEQRAELDAAAEAEELDTSTWLRQLGLLEARARRGAPERLRRIREAMRRLDEGRE